MKIFDIIKARSIIKNHSSEKVPTLIAYKFMKFLKISETEEIFYNEEIKKLAEECLEKDENGNFKDKVKSDFLEKWNEKVKELQDTEIDNFDFRLHIQDLECFELSINEVAMLDILIET